MLALLVLAPVLFGPKLPPGTRTEFQLQVLAVTDRLEKGDFAGAQGEIAHLPVADPKIEWDDRGLPAAQKTAAAAARDGALAQWREAQAMFKPRVVAQGGDIRFHFVHELPVDPESGVHAGAAYSFSSSPGKPALEVAIALARGETATPIKALEVSNEVARAVGAYYGLADSPYFGTFMSHTDVPTDRLNRVTGLEGNVIRWHLLAVAELEARIGKKQVVKSARPVAVVDPQQIDAGTAVQGEGAEFQIKLTNTGNAPLTYRLIPDCQCFLISPGGDVAAGASFVLRGRMDTTVGQGEVKHRLLVMTNDLRTPNRVVPFRINLQPRYRFLIDAPDVLLLPKGPATIHAYLFGPAERPISASAGRLAGLNGTVSAKPWEGPLADPAMKEGPLQRKGTEFTIHLDAAGLVGRGQFTLQADTDDGKFSTVQVSQSVQRGIGAQPSEIYFGEVTARKSTSFLLTRPGKPFRVVSTSVDNAAVKVAGIKASGGDGYEIELQFMGGSRKGPVYAVLTVNTDDPDQPTVKVPIQALVK